MEIRLGIFTKHVYIVLTYPNEHMNQPPADNSKDDLDLVTLAARIFNFFGNYGRTITLFSLAGLLAGLACYMFIPKKYASSLLLHSFTLTNTEQINIIENWNNLLKAKEYKALAAHFNCDESTVEKIIRIRASEIQKLYIPNNPNGFLVEVLVKDNAVLDSLGDRIVYGLENSDYIRARLATRRSDLTQLINSVNTEIIKLDSTKRNIENNINHNSPNGASYIIDVSSINTQMIGLKEKLLSYQAELKFSNAVQVLHKFEKFEKPDSPKLLKSILLGLIGGFSFGYVFSLYRHLHKRLALYKQRI